MSITADLGETLEKTVADLVSSGRYRSQTDVLREGVRLVQQQDAQRKLMIDAIERGVADADAGRVEDAFEFLDRLSAEYQRQADK